MFTYRMAIAQIDNPDKSNNAPEKVHAWVIESFRSGNYVTQYPILFPERHSERETKKKMAGLILLITQDKNLNFLLLGTMV